jgi:16S rRNA (guanine527-N7)-methyltransferase
MSRPDTATRILRRAERLGLEVGADALRQVATYFDLLHRWNRTVNLTALDEGEEALDRLIIEPLIASRWLPGSGLLLDVGSGGGSPAIPLKVSRPALDLVMVESKTRKAAFLREVTRQTGLAGVRVEARRLEELLSDPTLHEAADVVSVRAVRVDRRLLTRLLAFAKPQGHVLLFSGPGVGAPAVERPWTFAGEVPLVTTLGSRLIRLCKDVPASGAVGGGHERSP